MFFRDDYILMADNGPKGPVPTQTNERDQTSGNTLEEDMESINDLTGQDIPELIPIPQTNRTSSIEGEASLDPRDDSPSATEYAANSSGSGLTSAPNIRESSQGQTRGGQQAFDSRCRLR